MTSSDEIIEMSDSETHELRLRAGIPSVSEPPKIPEMVPKISRVQTAALSSELNLPPLQELELIETSRQSTPPKLTLQMSSDNMSISSQWGYSMASIEPEDDDDSLFDTNPLDECSQRHSRTKMRDENGSISMAIIDPQSSATPPYALYDSNDECESRTESKFESILRPDPSPSPQTELTQTAKVMPYLFVLSQDDIDLNTDLSADTIHLRQQVMY